MTKHDFHDHFSKPTQKPNSFTLNSANRQIADRRVMHVTYPTGAEGHVLTTDELKPRS